MIWQKLHFGLKVKNKQAKTTITNKQKLTKVAEINHKQIDI